MMISFSLLNQTSKEDKSFPSPEDEDDLFTDQRGTKNGSKIQQSTGYYLKAQDIFEVIGHKNTFVPGSLLRKICGWLI